MAKKPVNKPMSPAHIKFCEHYSEYSNATQAYLFAFPNVTYGSAKTEGPRLLAKPDISERIQQLNEEFECQFRQDKRRTIRDLMVSAEEAKKIGEWASYVKLRDLIIKVARLTEPEVDNSNKDTTIKLELPGLESEEEETDEQTD